MSWLVKMEIDSEVARREEIRDSYDWHKKLWACFPTDSSANRDFLTRVDQLEGAFRLWVMGNRKPERPSWCSGDEFALKEIAPSFFSHRFYAFDLMANPIKVVLQQDEGGHPIMTANGGRKKRKRVPIVKQSELRDWLVRKGDARCKLRSGEDVPGGFRILEGKPLEITPMVESYFRKKDKKTGKTHAAYHGGVQFRGTLEVTNQERFIETYQAGIGSAKSFGFGLFLLAPVKL